MKTQNQRVIEYLQRNGSITQLEAWTQIGVMRLASRISDLRSQGVSIAKRMIDVANRYGESCKVAEYSLNKPSEGGQK